MSETERSWTPLIQRYQKRPVVVEARHWLPGDKGSASGRTADWLNYSKPPAKWRCEGLGEKCAIFIATLEGEMRCDPGDWIIRGIQGEFYPCKPDVFDATYEPVVSSSPREANE